MDKLNPCPFCGNNVSVTETVIGFPHDEYFVVFCENCPAHMDNFTSVEKAIKAWNTRYVCKQPLNNILGGKMGSKNKASG